MGVQRLGPRKLRRLERIVGQPLDFAVAFGGYEYEFVTKTDEHGVYSLKDGRFMWMDGVDHFFPACPKSSQLPSGPFVR